MFRIKNIVKQTKRRKVALESFERSTHYALADAIRMVKETASTKFDETIELSLNLGALHHVTAF